MNLHLVRPPVADLVFQVYAKPLHPELFDILATRTWQRAEWCASVHITRGVVYQTSFQTETLPPEIFLHVHDEILAEGGKRGLLCNFQPHHRLAIAPLGLVTLETRAGCIFVTSFHTFPEENAVVKAQTLIEMT